MFCQRDPKATSHPHPRPACNDLKLIDYVKLVGRSAKTILNLSKATPLVVQFNDTFYKPCSFLFFLNLSCFSSFFFFWISFLMLFYKCGKPLGIEIRICKVSYTLQEIERSLSGSHLKLRLCKVSYPLQEIETTIL